MNRLNFFSLIILFLLILNGCGTVKEGFKNPKKNTSDEFLVEKKSPLVMPPNFEELPVPKKMQNLSDIKKSSIKEMIIENKIDENETIKTDKNLEENILKKIKTD
tara:strand:+ start:101 stop:415 length:315 start_codon:yes stop_codon:yes gene_type:complete